MSLESIIQKPIVLVGLMGVGKTSVGKSLAKLLGIPFCDADDEIVKAAGCSINEIFELYGEKAFRDGERKVISRLLNRTPMVLATGGGAFIDDITRNKILEKGVSVWLKAPLETIVKRTEHRNDRPLLKINNSSIVLKELMHARDPIYKNADMAIDASEKTINNTAKIIFKELKNYYNKKGV